MISTSPYANVSQSEGSYSGIKSEGICPSCDFARFVEAGKSMVIDNNKNPCYTLYTSIRRVAFRRTH